MIQLTEQKAFVDQWVIIVEDDIDLREIMLKYLTLAGFNIVGVGSAHEFYQELSKRNYVLAILDIGLPDQSGLVLAEYLRTNTDIRIIMLTAHATIDDKVAGYQTGADSYMVKPVDCRELTASIASHLTRINAARSTQTPHQQAAQEKKNPDSTPWKLIRLEWVLLTPGGDPIKLTSKEYDFIAHLVMQHRKMVDRQEIMKTLSYPPDIFGSRALDSMIYRLRNKIEAHNCTVPIKTAHRSGYCFISNIVIV